VCLKSVLLLLLVLIVVDVFFGVDQVGVEGRALPRLLRLMLCLIMFIWVISDEQEYAIGLSFGFSVLLLGFVMGASVAISSDNLRVDIVDLSKTYYWILGFFFITGMTRYGVLTSRTLMYFTVSLVLLLFLKILILDILSGAPDATSIDYRNDGWALVLCVPLVLLIEPSRKKVMYICFILIVVAVLLAIKRGAILALASATACWLIASTGSTLKAKLISVLKVVGIISLAGLVIISRLDAYAERLTDISAGDVEQVGSGRGLLYKTVWQRLETADGFTLALGHGYNSVASALSDEIGVRLYAHSDFLEVFHNHGLVGVLFWLMMFASLVRLWSSLRMLDPASSVAVLCAIAILAVKGLISMAIYEPTMIYVSMAIGYVRGKVAYDAHISNVSDLFDDAAVGDGTLQI
jgi:O-Antigen ligase